MRKMPDVEIPTVSGISGPASLSTKYTFNQIGRKGDPFTFKGDDINGRLGYIEKHYKRHYLQSMLLGKYPEILDKT
jgi:hypothetical protein